MGFGAREITRDDRLPEPREKSMGAEGIIPKKMAFDGRLEPDSAGVPHVGGKVHELRIHRVRASLGRVTNDGGLVPAAIKTSLDRGPNDDEQVDIRLRGEFVSGRRPE